MSKWNQVLFGDRKEAERALLDMQDFYYLSGDNCYLALEEYYFCCGVAPQTRNRRSGLGWKSIEGVEVVQVPSWMSDEKFYMINFPAPKKIHAE